jgi:glycosyltransferase involved in cell wall biosynthesis
VQLKLTVLITTYNHESFIEEALDSVVTQRLTSEMEVLVGDDASTDRTRTILLTWRDRHPGLIRLFLPDRNLGCSGTVLFMKLLEQARGQYIALLDGDDFWLSPDKLQHQVAYLDSRPECSLCWHRAYNLYPDGRLVPYEDNFEYEQGKSVYSLRDIMFQNFIPTCSVVFRNGLIGTLPRSFTRMPSPDWFFNAMLAERGFLGLLDDVWGVRRVHPGGVISMKPATEKLAFNIKCVRMVNRYLHHVYQADARRRLAYLHRELALIERSRSKKAWHAANCLRLSPRDERWSRAELGRMIIGDRFVTQAARLLKPRRTGQQQD